MSTERENRKCRIEGCENPLDKRNVTGYCYEHFSKWTGGRISGLRDYSSKDNTRRIIKQELIKIRKICENCGESRPEFLQLDHIIPLASGGSDEIANLRLLCGPCHEKRHSSEPVISIGKAGVIESEREKVRMAIALEGTEGSREMILSPTLWSSWNAWMKTEIIKFGFVSSHDAIHESSRWLKEKWGQGSSVTTRRYLAEAVGDGKNGDYVKAWNPNLGNIIKFSERMEKRLLEASRLETE